MWNITVSPEGTAGEHHSSKGLSPICWISTNVIKNSLIAPVVSCNKLWLTVFYLFGVCINIFLLIFGGLESYTYLKYSISFFKLCPWTDLYKGSMLLVKGLSQRVLNVNMKYWKVYYKNISKCVCFYFPLSFMTVCAKHYLVTFRGFCKTAAITEYDTSAANKWTFSGLLRQEAVLYLWWLLIPWQQSFDFMCCYGS